MPVPGVVFRPLLEEDAWTEIRLAWAAAVEDPVVGRFVCPSRKLKAADDRLRIG